MHSSPEEQLTHPHEDGLRSRCLQAAQPPEHRAELRAAAGVVRRRRLEQVGTGGGGWRRRRLRAVAALNRDEVRASVVVDVPVRRRAGAVFGQQRLRLGHPRADGCEHQVDLVGLKVDQTNHGRRIERIVGANVLGSTCSHRPVDVNHGIDGLAGSQQLLFERLRNHGVAARAADPEPQAQGALVAGRGGALGPATVLRLLQRDDRRDLPVHRRPPDLRLVQAQQCVSVLLS